MKIRALLLAASLAAFVAPAAWAQGFVVDQKVEQGVGAIGDGPYTGAGNASIIAGAKGIYAKVAAPIGPVTPGTVAAGSMLAGCQFNSGAPTVTNLQQVAAQCDAGGNLLVKLNAALPAGAATIGAVNQGGAPWSVTVSGAPTLANDNTVSGSLSAPGTVVLNTQGAATAIFTISGTGAGLAGTFQGQVTGSATWIAVPSLFQGGAGSMPAISPGGSNFASGNGTYVINSAGFAQVRLNLTAISSGTLTALGEASAGQQLGFGINYLAGSNSLLAGVSNPSSVGDATTLGNSLLVVATPYLYNGTTQDRARSVQALGDGVAGIGMTAAGTWGWNGTTWDRLKSTSGALNVSVTGTPTVTANAGTNLNTSALALDTSVNGLLLSQASTTSGQKGALVQGAVTTAAPTYATGQSDPLSLTTAGALRTDSSATTQPVSAASLPLPTGAATAAKQPALGTAGTPSTDVVTVQGAASMTPFKIDGSATTQPVTGTGSAGTPAAGIVTVQGNASGTPVPTICTSGCSGGPADGTAFTPGVTSIAPGGVYNDQVAPLASGTIGEPRLTANRAEHVNRRDSAGRELGASLPGQLSVPIVVALAPTMPPPPTLRPPTATLVLPASQSTVTLPGGGPDPAARAQVTVQALTPSLQCPFVAPVNTTSSAVVVPGKPGKRTMICEKFLNLAGAEGISLSEGTGATCGTGTTFLSGGAGGTIQLAANGGFLGSSDRITLPLQNIGDDFCLIKSGANNASGHVTYGYY